MKKYSFAVPIKLRYIADESDLSIESVEDLEHIQNLYDVDLQYIIDEYEYKVEMDKGSSYDDDYYAMSNDDMFVDIINERWDEIVELLNKDIGFNEISDDDCELIFNKIKNNFNSSNLIKNSVLEFNKKNTNINIIDMVNYNKFNNEIYVNISSESELNESEIDNIKNMLEYQINESWGEDISNEDLSGIINEDNYYVYLIPWSLKNEIEIV